MIKLIHFLGDVILWLATFVKMLQNLLKFFFLFTIVLGILMFTMLATFEALHFIRPLENASGYGIPLDIFGRDLWAWVVAILGWTTMLYGIKKMFDGDKEYYKKLEEESVTRKSNTWVE